jgi:fluoroquinolone resistance protein
MTVPEARLTVTGEDWYGREVQGERFADTDFVAVDFGDLRSVGAVFENCTFRRCRFNTSVHTDSAFTGCTFAYCTFFDARFVRCKLVGSTFTGCEFDLVQVDGGNWGFVALAGAALGSTQWRGVRLTEADLDRVQAVGAVWRDLDLTGASLVGIDLRQADLRGSSLWSLDPAAAQLSGAIVTPEQALVIAAALGLDVRVDD